MRHLRGKSLTLRLTLLFAGVSGAVLLVLGVVVGHLVDGHFVELDKERLNGKLELVRHALAEVGSPEDLSRLRHRLDDTLIGEQELVVRIRSEGGQVLYASDEADSLGPRPVRATSDALQFITGSDGRSLRLLSGSAALGDPGGPRAIVEIATGVHHHQAFMASFQITLWITVGLAASVSGVLGWAAARSGLAPLRRIGRDAAAVTAERLDRRLPVGAIPVELAELALALNQMLERLQDSFRRLTEFSSDLAHELRTPVNNLLTQTQVILARPRPVEDYLEVLASNVEEYERLSRTISDMLFLAKADNDLLVPDREVVDLRREVEAIAEFYGPLVDEKAITLTVGGAAHTVGDRLMLRRAISNLLSNACRHAPPGGGIAVELSEVEAGIARICVRNTGESISPEHLPHLFERFYRADASRKREAEGSGLGLAITRSIMRAHGGDATVRSSDGVTVFELQLPG